LKLDGIHLEKHMRARYFVFRTCVYAKKEGR